MVSDEPPEVPFGPGAGIPGRQPGDPDNRAVDRLILTSKDPESRIAALRALAGATVLLLGHPSEEEGGSPTPVQISGPDGPLYPFFTSRALTGGLLGVLPPTPSLAEQWLPCWELLRIAVEHNMDLIFNPGTKFAGEIPVSHASDLLAGREPGTESMRVGEDSTLRTGEPAVIPAALVEGIRHVLARKPFVERAYLRWVEHEDGLQGYLIVFVSDAPRERVIEGLAEIHPYVLAGNQTVETIVVPTSRDLGRTGASEPIWPITA